MNRRTIVLTTLLVLLAIFATAFGMINYQNSVRVWPLQNSQPLTFVIGVSFFLGASTVGLLSLLFNHKRASTSASSVIDFNRPAVNSSTPLPDTSARN